MISYIHLILLRVRLKRNTNRKYEELSEVSGGLFSSWRKVGNLKKICLVNCNKTLLIVCLFFFITVVLFLCKLLMFCKKSVRDGGKWRSFLDSAL